MSIKITTLVEISVYGKGLQGEHGLSLLVDTGEHRLLFDTGASDLLYGMPEHLGLTWVMWTFWYCRMDIATIRADLHHFLAMNHKAKVICKKEFFFPKFKEERENGVMRPDALIEPVSALWKKSQGCVPAYLSFRSGPLPMRRTRILNISSHWWKGRKQADTFTDELALVLKQGDEVSVLSACSHRGITNIIRRVQEYFPAGLTEAGIGRIPYP